MYKSTTHPGTKYDHPLNNDDVNLIVFCNVIFHKNYDTEDPIHDAYLVLEKSKLGEDFPEDPQRSGYKFIGWNTQKDGRGTAFTADTNIESDITLYAQWESAGVKITYDPNGGEFRGSTGLTSENHLVGEKMTIAEAATRSGYKFLYWEGSKYFPGDTYEVVGDHTFTAIWEKETPGLRPSGIQVTTPGKQYLVTISNPPTQKRITNLPATGSHDSYISALGLLAIGLILILKKR